MRQIRESGKMDEEDILMLTHFIIISKVNGNDPEGKTYDEIFISMKDLREKTRSSKDQMKNIAVIKQLHLNPLLKVQLIKKEFSKLKNQEIMIYTISFENLTKNNIRTVIGKFSFQDILEKEREHLDILFNTGLKGGYSITKSFSVKYDPLNDQDTWMRNKPLSDIKVEWIPDKIIYSDGKLFQ